MPDTTGSGYRVGDFALEHLRDVFVIDSFLVGGMLITNVCHALAPSMADCTKPVEKAWGILRPFFLRPTFVCTNGYVIA